MFLWENDLIKKRVMKLKYNTVCHWKWIWKIKCNTVLYQLPKDVGMDLLLVALKPDLAMVCLTMLGVMGDMRHLSNLAISGGNASTFSFGPQKVIVGGTCTTTKRQRVTMRRQWRDNGVTMNRQWGDNGKIMRRQWADNEETMGWQWGDNGVTIRRQSGDNKETMGWQWGDNGVTMRRQWDDDKVTMGWQWGDAVLTRPTCWLTSLHVTRTKLFLPWERGFWWGLEAWQVRWRRSAGAEDPSTRWADFESQRDICRHGQNRNTDSFIPFLFVEEITSHEVRERELTFFSIRSRRNLPVSL